MAPALKSSWVSPTLYWYEAKVWSFCTLVSLQSTPVAKHSGCQSAVSVVLLYFQSVSGLAIFSKRKGMRSGRNVGMHTWVVQGETLAFFPKKKSKSIKENA
mmetsp:Transcript_5354/g.10492  ORF Transcript_5354/g.10492 Transcript_5354/m.10492 type:complete len:101 (-) Transcript_5354:161-463(-)